MPFGYMKTLAAVTLLASCSLAPSMPAASAQGNMGGMKMNQPAGQKMPSPPATATVTLGGKDITIHYNSPSMRGRKIMGDVVPFGKTWRTGANPATTLITSTNLKIGTIDVPAGKYTLYTLPSQDTWTLIINKQTGQWGTEYNQDQDLGRTPMTGKTLSSPQEVMSISFENTSGKSTELHIKWEKTDQYVKVEAE